MLIALGFAFGCGSGEVARSVPAVGVQPTLAPTPMSTAATRSSVKKRGPSPLTLVDGDGIALIYIDFAKLPPKLMPLADRFFLENLRGAGHTLPELARACDTRVDALIDQLVISFSSEDRQLVVVRSADGRRLASCVQATLGGESEATEDGAEVLRLGERLQVRFQDDLVLFGHPMDVTKAVRRLRGGAPVEGKLIERVAPGSDAVVMALDLPEEVQLWLRVKPWPTGLRVDAEGRPPKGLPPQKRPRVMNKLKREREKLRREVHDKLVDLFGENDPLLTSWRREDEDHPDEVTLRWTFDLRSLNERRVVAALASLHQEQLIKTAQNNLGAIARGATAAFESNGNFCTSAPPVPARVPAATTYVPKTTPGRDFDTGDRRTGWRCIRFSITQPIRYRYTYRHGSGYRGPARGLPDPGPRGFEVSAEGDLDGDGKTSLFTITGSVNPATGMLVVSPTIATADPSE